MSGGTVVRSCPHRVGGVGGCHKLTLPQTEQVVFPHHPLHPFAIDGQAATAQLR